MVEKIWKIVKNNFAAILAVCTTSVTVAYAIAKLIVYVYWRGYFDKLNINSSFMKINYDGFIFQGSFMACIIVVIIYFMKMLNDMFGFVWKNNWKAEAKRGTKVKKFFQIGIIDILLSIMLLPLANLPLVIVFLLGRQINLVFSNVVLSVFVLSVTEILWLCLSAIDVKEREQRSIEMRISSVLLRTIVYISVGLASVYYFGNQYVNAPKNICFVQNEEYVISYNNGEQYILHKAERQDEKLVIKRNEQKIIDVKECEYISKKIEKIVIED